MRRTWVLLVLTSCESNDTGNGDDPTNADADTDTDSDTDSDTDADTDTDTDTDSDADTDVPPVEVCVLIEDHRYGSDGTLLQEELYTYDANFFLVERREEFGTFEDPPDNTIYYTNDAAGRVVLTETDNASDGGINSIQSRIYDAAGLLLEDELDLGNDGAIDLLITNTYDGSGRIVLLEYDTDPVDGVVELVTTSSYNDDGHLWIEEQRNEANAVLVIRTYTYDVLGQKIELESDAFGDGSVNFRFTWEYDLAGNMVKEIYSDAVTGELINVNTYTYDANGLRLTWWQEFPDSAVLLPNMYTYTYDVLGNLILLQADLLDDGVDISEHTYTWDCP